MSNQKSVRKNHDHANLAGADLSEADLSQASLRSAVLADASLHNANLAGSDLHGANLDHADVTGANLRNAGLTDASLHGVDLSQAATEGIRLVGAEGASEELTKGGSQPIETHMPDTAAEIVHLNQQIADEARAIYAAAEPTERDPQAAIHHISELRLRRNLREERLLSLMEEALGRRQPTTLNDR